MWDLLKSRDYYRSDYYWPAARDPSRIATGRAISTLTELRLVPLRLIFFFQFYPYVTGQNVSILTELGLVPLRLKSGAVRVLP